MQGFFCPFTKVFLAALVAALYLHEAEAALFKRIGTNKGSTDIQMNGVESGMFDPVKMTNFHYDSRYPLISPNVGGSCPGNIYNPSAVNNGGDLWNVYFGGWDGVSQCHDSVSIVVTDDAFTSLNPHYPMIATGMPSIIHTNNPSAIKFSDSNTEWLMSYTQLVAATGLNKPGISQGATGIDWAPKAGGFSFVNMSGYPRWTTADVNGGNVLARDEATGELNLFFVDFKAESQHSVFRAVCPSSDVLPNFSFRNVALEEPFRVVNDMKNINGHWVMALHMNSQQVWVSVAPTLGGVFPPSKILFAHMDSADKYITSVGLVVDATGSRLLGALYGAGADPALDQNRIFAVWLQKKVLFVSADGNTTWGVGDASRAMGPNSLRLATNAVSLVGSFHVYDTDYVDANHRGTLLAVSDVVTVHQGDIWEFSP